MRLATRLILSKLVVATFLLVALVFALASLIRVNTLASETHRERLGDLGEEEQLHKAAWQVEVAVRRGLLACEQDSAAGPSVLAAVERARDGLDDALQETEKRAGAALRSTALGYRALAARITLGNTCEQLRELGARRDRLVLNEEMTDAWIARLYTVRTALIEKETEAHRIGAYAIAASVALGILACVAAAAFARQTTRAIAIPLSALEQHARRVGEGDFSPLPPIRGPVEIRQLSLELDRMRARLGELDNLKQAFIAAVSHDLRTPLARLREALGLLADGTAGPITDRQARVLTLARSACEREIRLVSALLDISRVRAGRSIKREAGCPLEQVIDRAVDTVGSEAEEVGVRVEVDAPFAIPPANLDAPLVERALVNLLSNAISVSSRGQVVRVEPRLVERDGSPDGRLWADIFVRDDGPGVEPEVRGHLFEPFLSGSTGRRGVGLGLSLAREMIRAHGGDILLVDEPRPGATFVVRLPLGLDLPAEGGAPRADAPPAVGSNAP